MSRVEISHNGRGSGRLESGRNRMRKNVLLILCVIALVAAAGAAAVKIYPKARRAAAFRAKARADAGGLAWPDAFQVIEIRSSVDGKIQKAYYYRTSSLAARPLVVSLHGWSSGFSKGDSLAALAREHDWNYIHPDFRGPGRTPDACLSEKVISDIDDAVANAIARGGVDTNNVFVAGASGGGYAAAGMYLRSRHAVRAFLAWVPVTDLRAWYRESLSRGNGYAGDILKCTSSGEKLDEEEAVRRSPLYWDLPASPRGIMELYAGIDDGHSGPVPISHSILFYNRIVERYGDTQEAVTPDETTALLNRVAPRAADPETISGRRVILRRGTGYASITIFEGGHEMLAAYCFERMNTIAGDKTGSGDRANDAP
jgi:pimeloyl-ACP methyl ester carboxylesterase